MQDSIIVYHNPLEKALWEGGVLIPCLAAVVVFVLIFYFTLCFLEKIFKKKNSLSNWCYVVTFLLSSSLAGLVFYYTVFFFG